MIEGMKVRVVCAGTFDHLHPGHLHFLNQAKALGDELIVIVARDETVRRIKGFTPTDSEATRKSNVENAGIADRVFLGNMGSDLFGILEELRPQVIALGYDQRIAEEDLLKRFPGCSVKRLAPFKPEKYKSSFYRSKKK